MSDTFEAVKRLVAAGDIRISEHGYDEIADDEISVREIVNGLNEAVVVEDYPVFVKGPAVLVLQLDAEGRPVHVVWGVPKDREGPAVLVTAYRPDAGRWSADFLERLR